jgi:hypothetical protein
MLRVWNFTHKPVDRKTLNVLFQMTQVIIPAFLHKMPLPLKMAIPQEKIGCVLHLAKKDSVTAVQLAFRTQFHMAPPSRVCIYACNKKQEQKGYTCKDDSPV